MATQTPFRVLVVHADPKRELDLTEAIARWPGYQAVAVHLSSASGMSVEDWCNKLREKIREHRCHVVLIDRSCVSKNLDLEMLERALRPAQCVLYVGPTVSTERAMRAFLSGVLLASPSRTSSVLSPRMAMDQGIRRKRAPSLEIEGVGYLQKAADAIEVSHDEIEDLIAHLFPEARMVQVEPLRCDASHSSVLRGRSALLTVSVDRRVEKVLKIASNDKVEREIANYRQFVHDRLTGMRYAVLVQHKTLWNIGGLVYSLIGTGKELPPTFAERLSKKQATDTVERILEELFDAWSLHYTDHFGEPPQPTDEPLFVQYNEAWLRKLEAKLDGLGSKLSALPLSFDFLPHSVEWVAQHRLQSRTRGMRKAITHGDLHAENILVDRDGHCWCLDFERTGWGPILQDFTELETDIVSRLTIAPRDAFFRLCVLLAAPTEPTISVSSYLKEYEDKRRGFLPSSAMTTVEALISLHALAAKHASYQDSRERLWGILLNTIYAMGLNPEPERLEKLLVLGGVICRRLEGWDNYRQAPPWPPTEWEKLLFSSTEIVSRSIGDGLDLRVRLENNSLRYMISGGRKYAYREAGQVALLGSPREILGRVFNQLSTLAAKRMEALTSRDAETLDDVGHNLYRELFSSELRHEYQDFVRSNPNRNLLIISDDPWIPWEIVKPQLTEGSDPHLCEHFYLARWFSGEAPPLKMELNRAVVVRPPSNLQAAQREEEYIKALTTTSFPIDSVVTMTKVEEVLESFRAGDTNLYHFACHGNFDGTDPNESRLTLEDGYLTASAITGDKQRGLRRARPLVFLNACHTGQLGFGLTQIGGWARRFVEAGASAFIGTLWAVNDHLAATFAIEFYNRLLGLEGHQPMPLAQALHDARMVIKNTAPANPTWLAYVLYGDPNARVAQSEV